MENVIEYFINSAKQNPNKLFVCDSEKQYTYGKALEIVSSIACFFADKNIRNQPIMLKAERNCDSLLTILGIVYSNNFYVSVNPAYTQEKLDSIVETSCIRHAVSFDRNFDEAQGIEFFDFEDIRSYKSNAETLKSLEKDFNVENPIYTVYTSGSTGKPKGVIKTQKNVIAFVNNFVQTFRFENGLNIANQAPLFFDASMKDVYLCIATCSTLYFPDKTLFAVPLKLVEYLNDNKINYVCWVPSALTIVARLNTFKYLKPKYLKYVTFVGEVFLPKYLNIWIEALPDVTFCNLYGSTEIMGVCLYKKISGKLPEDKPIPLGKPLANNTVFLDDGEIVVLSDQIATGYINDPEKNAKVFQVKDGKKYLRTGDFGFENEEGDIVFSSRKDFQIKHMGYRIELQEIDLSVARLEYIGNCAVLYDQSADKIVAFVTLSSPLENPAKTIISDLKEILPAYMVPNKIVVLDELPLNANGKIDRVKLKETIGE